MTRILVEAWGAGGGGGAGAPNGTGGGGGGGAGAYQRRVIGVVPGATYEVVPGTGGAGGALGAAGSAGGDTAVRDPRSGALVLVAGGGQGGGVAVDATSPGASGAGGRLSGTDGIARPGADGASGSPCRLAPLNPATCLGPGAGGEGGTATRGSVDPPGGVGKGGGGGTGGGGRQPGLPGHVILQW